ncbi:toxin Cry1Ac domain D-VI-related protein [Listeria monocytogenes]|uniref:hypothetical protein n=1 Tax=Listeria monocytogenes TaxID=1639 RepID=UPI0017A85FC1|nr:hypothetical protein [Listeria monocytogenes]EAE9169122.1 hypothetical protein [Listeria monocytogenes]EAF2351038.1 hypothetical protein [Listeria monocytogenes]EAF5462202.1 hypothetical protein [Listeria monocytogenes]EAF9608922.1 hypothetical protein [Listeria monocytogenes]EAH0493897.1 hypothetical protein [Listeria monocytogenes]
MKKSTKKTGWLIAIGVIVLAGIGWGVFTYTADQKEQAEKKEQEKQVMKLEKQVNDLYQDTDKEMLKTGISEKDIQAAEKSLDAFKGKTVVTVAIKQDVAQITKDWSNADYMYTYRLQVEKLLDPNKVLREDADLAQVATQRKDLLENTKKEAFAKSFDPIVEEATAQQNQIDVANQQVTALYSNFDKKEVKKGLTRVTYNQAKASVDKIKQAKAKQTLTTNLKPADDALKAADKQAAEAKAKEPTKVAAAQEASASQEAASNEANTEASTSSGANNSGSSGSSSNSGSSSSSGGSSQKSASGSTKGSSGSSAKSSGGSASSKGSASSGKSSSGSSSSGSKSNGSKGGNNPKTDYNTKEEGINGSTGNQNGGTDTSWGW